MTRTGGDLFVDALEQYGVTHLFGNPGTTELPVMKALEGSDLEYVLALHEDVAVGAAAGYASTRRHQGAERPLGVVNLHVAPGLAHGLGNLYNASVANVPLLVTAGNHSRDFRHEEPILSGDLEEIVGQFCKDSAEVLDVSAFPTMLRRAVRVALTPPTGPVFLGLPLDVMNEATDADPEPLGPIPDAGAGDPEQIDRAADLLVDADHPVMVLGDGVAQAGESAVEAAVSLAEATGARVHAEMLAGEVNFPTDHDQWVSFIPPSADLARTLHSTDTLVFAGVSTHTTTTRYEGELVPDDADVIQISADPWEVGKNYPAAAGVVGDPGRVMDAVADQVRERLPEGEREERLTQVASMKQLVRAKQEEMVSESDPEDPRTSKPELVDALRAAAPGAYVVNEGVTATRSLLTRWPLDTGGMVSNKGWGLGYGLPAAVGAAVAADEADWDRKVLGFVGDGSYLYYPHAAYTAARYDLDLTVVVPDNRGYRILKDNTLALFGGDEADYEFVGMDFEPAVDIPANAESHGVRGHLVETADEIESVVGEAISRSGTDVVDVAVHD